MTVMSNQDGLDPKEFDELIARLSRRKQESPGAKIPFQDVKDILQDEGLLESLLREHISSRNHSIEAIEHKCKKQLSRVIKGLMAITIALVSCSTFVGYWIGSKFATDSADRVSLSNNNAFSEKNKSLEAKVSDLEGQISSKDDQIKDLISKVGSVLPNSSTSPSASISSSSQGFNNTSSDTDFDSVSVSLQGCNRVSKSVKCSLSIISKVDQTIGVGHCGSDSKTRFFDLQGIEHKASFVEFANHSDRYGCTVETALIKDVPAKAVLTFSDIALGTKSMKALEISVAIKGEKDTEWQFPQYREVSIK
jgi:hypothetical protein